MEKCIFIKSWVGRCKLDAIHNQYCAEHSDKKCVNCGEQATHDCDQTMSAFVCGAPLCNDCEHTIFKEGYNQPVDSEDIDNKLPMHVAKGEQKYHPWYMRDE